MSYSKLKSGWKYEKKGDSIVVKDEEVNTGVLYFKLNN